MKKVLVITGSRGEYGYIRPFLEATKNDPFLDVHICVTNMHLLQEHGMTIDEFEKDGFSVNYKCLNTFSGNTRESMLKSLFVFGLSLCDILTNSKYDYLLLAGDRGEQLISAIAGFHLDIITIHIQAGERSGHIDGMSRHAIARFAHMHICANQDAYSRLLSFGEEEHRLKLYGAPQLDEIFSHKKLSDQAFEEKVGCIESNFILLVYHATSEELIESKTDLKKMLDFLENKNIFVVAIAPNSDAGGKLILDLLESRNSKLIKIFRNLDRELYLEMMRRCLLMIGNSSSGLLEAPVFGTPAINVGKRQRDRVRGNNVFDITSPVDTNELQVAFDQALSYDRNVETHYGDGSSTQRIINLIKELEPTSSTLLKSITR